MRITWYRFIMKNKRSIRFHLTRFSHNSNESLPMQKLNIICYAPVQHRNTVISKIETAVTMCGGYVDDFNFFSDLAVSLRILGIRQPDTLKKLNERLTVGIDGLRLDEQTMTTLNSLSSSMDRYALFILVQILFIDAKGELKQTVPAVNN